MVYLLAFLLYFRPWQRWVHNCSRRLLPRRRRQCGTLPHYYSSTCPRLPERKQSWIGSQILGAQGGCPLYCRTLGPTACALRQRVETIPWWQPWPVLEQIVSTTTRRRKSVAKRGAQTPAWLVCTLDTFPSKSAPRSLFAWQWQSIVSTRPTIEW